MQRPTIKLTVLVVTQTTHNYLDNEIVNKPNKGSDPEFTFNHQCIWSRSRSPGTPFTIWTTSSEFGTYRLCEQQRFRRACASAQSRQNLRCSLIQALSQEEPSDRKPDPWPLWMAWHAQLKFNMMECSQTQIRLTGLICKYWDTVNIGTWSLFSGI